ncbi:AsmA family protein [Pedobacter deserti]|uniref:AsmA family protein n=1 Tax=Pedobacter deserti TaxID=2817382 RepID=UPI00210C694C|nr:AsmA family protein [Pedobacter sp. SYSU D00382]
MPKWSKIAIRIFGVLVLVVLVMYMAIAAYVYFNREQLLVSITKKLNENLNGKMTVESMDPTFLSGFPSVSIKLKNVLLKDRYWEKHQHTLLKAEDFEIAVNALALVTGTIDINKISIHKAAIYLYTDSTGYSNSSIFRRGGSGTDKSDRGAGDLEIGRLNLSNVDFVLDNQKGYKKFHFNVDRLNAAVDYNWSDWTADIRLKTMARSLAFNTRKGSFIKDKILEGPFKISYTAKTGMLEVWPNELKIGNRPFLISGRFDTSVPDTRFGINIEVDDIRWREASALLASNISAKLNMFNLDKPIDVYCNIAGDMGPGGDPTINVKAIVKDNILSSPGGVVKGCDFTGTFTNKNLASQPQGDENSAIKLYKFRGTYEEIPFSIDTASIVNLDDPVATGVFKSRFAIVKLNNVIGDNMLKFGEGTADVTLAYKAGIVDFQLNKPFLKGKVFIRNGDVTYVPRKVRFKNTAISLDFTDNDLFIRNIKLQSGKSKVFMEGSIKNFLNLYYNAPEKIVLNWQVKSPEIHLGEFAGFLGTRKPKAKRRTPQSNFSDNLNEAFERSNVDMNVSVDKLYYNKFLASNVKASLLVSESGIQLRNVRLSHAGGSLTLNGAVTQQRGVNRFGIRTVLNNVDVKRLFYAFDNFGLTSLTAANLQGFMNAQAKVGGLVDDEGKLVRNSMNGNVSFLLRKGVLKDFEPVKNVGKFAFPFRDMDNITFSDLKGRFDIRGEKIMIKPMQISSSVLNMDVSGVYSMNEGTNIAVDVPLRNPKKDEDLTDEKEIKARRMKGIVLHLLATDGEDGKIKIKLNKNRDKSKTI